MPYPVEADMVKGFGEVPLNYFEREGRAVERGGVDRAGAGRVISTTSRPTECANSNIVSIVMFVWPSSISETYVWPLPVMRPTSVCDKPARSRASLTSAPNCSRSALAMVRADDVPVPGRLVCNWVTEILVEHLAPSTGGGWNHVPPRARAALLTSGFGRSSLSLAKRLLGLDRYHKRRATQSWLHSCPIGKKYQSLIGVCSRLCVDNPIYGSQLCVNQPSACSRLCATGIFRSVDIFGRCSRFGVDNFSRREANSAHPNRDVSDKHPEGGVCYARG
jgi:hypothetical protein